MAQLSPQAQALFDTMSADSQTASQKDQDSSDAQSTLGNMQQAVVTAQAQVTSQQQVVTDKASAAAAAHQQVAADSIALVKQLSIDFSFPLPPDFGG